MYVGALGAYTSSDVSWTHGLGSGDITTGYAGLYVSALSKTFFGAVAVLGGWSDYSSTRNIKLLVRDFKATNSHSGSQILTHADTGINFGIGGFTIRPSIRLTIFPKHKMVMMKKVRASLTLVLSLKTQS